MDINFSFGTLRATRENILKVLEPFSNDQLNKTPEGFNNNMIWNAAHVWITQELLCYKLSGLECSMNNEMIKKYRKGSKPEGVISEEEIEDIKTELIASVDRLENDIKSGVFKKYNDYTTSYGVTLRSVQDALIFNNIHEGMHLGTLLALRRLV